MEIKNPSGMLQSEMERLLVEDLGPCDDSNEIVGEMEAEAVIIAKEECIISGLREAEEIAVHLGLAAERLFDDGELVPGGSLVMTIKGKAASLLRAERLMLNFLGRMSGISTLTRSCVLLASGVRIACTRKTTPGFRRFEKRAVKLGGGDPHRHDLSGAVMIKDNHIKLMGLEAAIRTAKSLASFTKKIEVEVEGEDDALLAAKLGADIIMFDNMRPSEIRSGVALLEKMGLRGGLILEASGGITPKNLVEYASSGVDVISMGSLIKDARWIDLNMEIVGS